MFYLTPQVLNRFWKRVDKYGPIPDRSNPAYAGLDACWVWKGQRNGDGYGQIEQNGKIYGAHRISFLISRGQFPSKGMACHKCDNPACVNPSHLFDGSCKDNLDDMALKGRSNKANGDNHYTRTKPLMQAGERNPHSKLTDNNVRLIRKIFHDDPTVKMTTVAKQFGVSRPLVSLVVSKKIWKHVA